MRSPWETGAYVAESETVCLTCAKDCWKPQPVYFSEINMQVLKEIPYSVEADMMQYESLKCACCLFNHIFC